jgi:hypothetical protein
VVIRFSFGGTKEEDGVSFIIRLHCILYYDMIGPPIIAVVVVQALVVHKRTTSTTIVVSVETTTQRPTIEEFTSYCESIDLLSTSRVAAVWQSWIPSD